MKFQKINGLILIDTTLDMQEATQKCLEIAEKIVAVLDDGEIYKKYLPIRQKYFANAGTSPELDPHLKKIALENRELLNRVQLLRDEINSTESLENYVINAITKMQVKVLPKTKPGHYISVEESCSALLASLESRNESASIFRDQISKENNTLLERTSSLQLNANEELKKIHNHHIEIDHAYRQKENTIKQRLDALNNQIEATQRKVDDVEESNADLEDSMARKNSQAEALGIKLNESELKNRDARSRCEELRKQASLLMSELESKTKEIEYLQTKQRFGVQDPDYEDIDDLRAIEAEIESLERDNARLTLEIKKRRLAGVQQSSQDMDNEPTKLTTNLGF